MKCILFVLLLTSGSFSLLTKGQISVDLLKDREFINILDKGNTLLKKKKTGGKKYMLCQQTQGKKLESLKSNNNIKTPLTPEREGTKQKEQL